MRQTPQTNAEGLAQAMAEAFISLVPASRLRW